MVKPRLVAASLIVGLATFSVAVLPAQVAVAANDTVTNCNDSGAGSLRQAVLDASPGDTITFATSPPCSTVTLTSGAIDIATNLTIDGGGAPSAIEVSAQNESEDFDVESGVTATISGLTVDGGEGSQDGSIGPAGGINNDGTLAVNDTTVTDNSGGGIYNDGTLTVGDTIIF